MMPKTDAKLIERLTTLQQKIEARGNRIQEHKGEKKAVKRLLLENYGCATVEEGTKEIAKRRKAQALLRDAIEDNLDEIEAMLKGEV